MTDIIQMSAIDMAAGLRAGELTAGAVLAAHRAQVELLEPRVNAFVTLDWEAAEGRAAELDSMAAKGEFAGPLHGVPVAIKDCFETKDLRTTWGSRSFAEFVPGFDAAHVARLRAAGAVIIGKTNIPEFTFSGQTSNLVSGTTRNPLDTDKTVAGSSGGAAAALAGHMVALADGSDLGGSVRTPAAWCGLVGFRPSSGLIPYAPNPAPFDGLSVPGPMARSVRDLVLMQQVMQGNLTGAPLGFWQEMPALDTLEAPMAPGRVALRMEPFGAQVDGSIQAALAVLDPVLRQAGWQVEDAEPDLAPLMAHEDIIRGQCALQIRASLAPDMDLAGESFRTACGQAEGKSLADLIAYHTTRAEVLAQVNRFFDRYEFALWPTTTGLPFSADLVDAELPEDWRTVTLTPPLELPSITLPCGTSSDGMPVGVHITGPKGADAKLLRFARLLERHLSGD